MNQFKVAGIDYTIVRCEPDQMGGHIGQADFNAQEVRIGRQYTQQTKKIAVYHEIIHILSDTYGLKLSEQQVQIGTHALMGFLSENSEFNIQSILNTLE